MPGVPFHKSYTSLSEQNLCFFFATYLDAKGPIKSTSTIKNYVCHAKNYWLESGCAPVLLKSETYRGSWKVFIEVDQKWGGGGLFLFSPTPLWVPAHIPPPNLGVSSYPYGRCNFGFCGMLSSHVFYFEQVRLDSLVLIDVSGRELQTRELPNTQNFFF